MSGASITPEGARISVLGDRVRELERELRKALALVGAILRRHPDGMVVLSTMELERIEAGVPIVRREEIPGGVRLILVEQEETEA